MGSCPAHVAERLRSSLSWSLLGSRGFSRQTHLGNEQPGLNRGRGRCGVFLPSHLYSQTHCTHTTPQTQPHPAPDEPVPPSQKHTGLASYHSSPTQPIIPQTDPFGVHQKYQHFFFPDDLGLRKPRASFAKLFTLFGSCVIEGKVDPRVAGFLAKRPSQKCCLGSIPHFRGVGSCRHSLDNLVVVGGGS